MRQPGFNKGDMGPGQSRSRVCMWVRHGALRREVLKCVSAPVRNV